jgi:hypothetical protein
MQLINGVAGSINDKTMHSFPIWNNLMQDLSWSADDNFPERVS